MKCVSRAVCAVVFVLVFSQTGRAQSTAQFTFPTTGATGVDLSQPITWTTVTPVDKYYLYVGTAVGLKDLVDTGEITATSAMAYDVPTGQTIYARLWTKSSGVWTYVDITFVASTAPVGRATMTFPSNGASNADLTQAIQWTAVEGAQSYYLYVGTSVGANNLINSGEIQQTSYSGINLPVSQTLYARLYTKLGGLFRYRDTTFSAALRVPTVTFPTPNAATVDLNQPIQFSTVPYAQAYYLYVGTTAGATDVLNSGETSSTSFYAYDAPLGVTLYARAFAKVNGVWRSAADVPFTAAVAPTGRAVLTYPAGDGATNVVTSHPLEWTSVVGAQAYYLYIGTAVGLNDLVASGEIQATSYTATNLASNQTVYVRLWTKGGAWRYVDSTFTTACVNTVTPTAIAAAAAGQTGWVVVNTQAPNCTWAAPTSDATWLTLGTPIVDQWDGFVPRVLADQPLGYWAFHETTGTTIAADWTQHGFTGALVGGAAVNTLGSVDLDGVSGRVVVAPSPLLTMTTALTAEMWLQTTKSHARIIGAANDPWELYVGDGGVLELRLLGHVLRGNQVIADNQERFVDATWDGATASLYVDGVLDAQMAVAGTLLSSAGGLTMGAHPTRGDYFEGHLAVVVVLDHALTATQIADRHRWENGEQTSSAGVFSYTIASSSVEAARAATIAVAGQTVPVTQSPGAVKTTISLTAPFPGTTFKAPSSITLAADLASNVAIASVTFYRGTTSIGSTSAMPYTITWSSPAAGNYVLKAVATDAAGHTTTSSTVSVTVTSSGSGLGQLGRPIVSPPAGTYAAYQLVTLSAAPGTTIRYTTDGSNPTATSPVYSQPLAIAMSTQVRAAAFLTGWTPSTTLSAQYTVDSTGPVITQLFSPPATADGWNNGPVTVSFSCTDTGLGVSLCPGPVVFTSDGAGQSAVVSAADLIGNVTTVTVTANIDSTTLTLAINSPAPDSTVYSGTVSVLAAIGSTPSGIASASCNGQPATVVDGVIACDAPVRPGSNPVIVHAVNRAGTNVSSAVRVTVSTASSAVIIVPNRRTLTVGETLPLSAFDTNGQRVAVGWLSEDAAIASVDANGLVTAHATGIVNVSATFGSLSAVAPITVGAALSSGTVRWSAENPTAGIKSFAMVGIHSAGDAVFAVVDTDANGSGSSTVVRGLTIDGAQEWSVNAPLAATEHLDRVVGDVNGGLLLAVYDDQKHTSTLVRLPVPENGPAWRYDMGAFLGELAQGPDGTIFFVGGSFSGTWPSRNNYRYAVIAIDDATGANKFRVDNPIRSYSHTMQCGTSYHNDYEDERLIADLRVDALGQANATFLSHQAISLLNCAPGLLDYRTADFQSMLYRIGPSGAYQTTTVLERHFDLTDPTVYNPGIKTTRTVPDAQGGVLVGAEVCADASKPAQCQLRGRFVNSAFSVGPEIELPGLPLVSASGGTVYSSDSLRGTKKYNMVTGALSCGSSVAGTSVVALNNSRVAISTSAGTTILGSDCAAQSTGQPAFTDAMGTNYGWSNYSYRPSPIELNGDSWFGDTKAVVATESYSDSAAGYAHSNGGDSWSSGSAKWEKLGIFAQGHWVVGAPAFHHISILLLPTNQQRWQIWQAGDPDCSAGGGTHQSCFTNVYQQNLFATVGAGPTSAPCGGNLAGGINRGFDVQEWDTYQERLQYPPVSEDRLIKRLTELTLAYPIGAPVPYGCLPDFPSPDSYYNSNSFAAGLLNAADLPLPSFPFTDWDLFPGWVKPVPTSKFK